MKELYKILLLIGLLMLSVCPVVLAESQSEMIVDKIHESFDLEKSVYSIELLTEEIKAKNFTQPQIAVKPLYETTPIGRFSVVLKITWPDGKVEKEQIRVYIRKYAEVVVVSDRIKRFDEVSPELVSIERKEVTTLREDPLTSLEVISGMRARRNIAKDKILTKGDLELKPVVTSYSEVHIVYIDGLCRVSAAGKALQDGQAGELIRVKNKSSGKIVFARVVDKNLVTVDP